MFYTMNVVNDSAIFVFVFSGALNKFLFDQGIEKQTNGWYKSK